MTYTSGQERTESQRDVSYRTLRMDPELSRQESDYLNAPYDVLRLTLKEFTRSEDVSDLGRELSDYLENSQANLALDFSEVERFSPAAIGKLIRTDKRLKESDRRALRLKKIMPEVAEVFYITKLCNTFDIDEETEKRHQEHFEEQLRKCY